MDFNKFIDSIKRGLRTLAWVLKRNIRPPQLPVNDDRKTLLHLGCGPINAHGFINIDAQPLPHVHYVSDVFPLRMFPSDCADLIYASHILEHFPWVKTREVLKEWRRVLKPGGVLRLGVPDFEVLLDIYKDTNDLGEIRGPLMGGQSDQYNFHYAVFDERSLTQLLNNAGFDEIRSWDPTKAYGHSFQDTTSNIWDINGKSYAISLNLEAIK